MPLAASIWRKRSRGRIALRTKRCKLAQASGGRDGTGLGSGEVVNMLLP